MLGAKSKAAAKHYKFNLLEADGSIAMCTNLR